MRRLDPRMRQEIEKRDDEWVQEAHKLATRLRELEGKKEDKRGQLRNIQNVAESGDSWAALDLFIRYQAARGQLKTGWAEEAVALLGGLEKKAEAIARVVQNANPKDVHLEIVARVLGYAVRWHTWDVKGKEAS